ncbi:unnamed protein product [Victoria cruziana]
MLQGPFVSGKEISAADLALGPKLYHLEVALGHYKTWSIPESLHHLKAYMNFIFSRDSFEKTKPQKDDIVAGWRPKVVVQLICCCPLPLVSVEATDGNILTK